MLRTKASRSSALRVLGERDRSEVLALCDREPVENVFVSSRVQEAGLDPVRLGGQMWGYQPAGRLDSLCYVGANMVPVAATPAAVRAFAGRARMLGRRCSSIVGLAPAVAELWELLRPYWGRPRELRMTQPVMSIAGPPLVAPDRLVRRVRPDELDVLFPASIAMFTEEVGVSPVGADGGAAYRARVHELIAAGRSFARVENGQVVFKAEIGAVTPLACQVQGVWVRPELRGRGLAEAGMAAVVAEALRTVAPVVSLYVNDFNLPARAAYRRVGFREIATFASVLF
ncbi:MAG: GNAT family N-acetyltransferase [Actinobacteria bacterium]|nr:GNAT family N-acetyltransferase [Actinomycetota bacterium]MBO0784545.1 GNAT family N-acetyltransferase [Actinomycetota bacterium]